MNLGNYSFDFTFKIFKNLINSLLSKSYKFVSVREYLINHPESKTIILRHDVDKLPLNSLAFAEFEHELGITGTYYFRMVPDSFNENIIKAISNMGHEIGYHYEDANLVLKNHPDLCLRTSKNLLQDHKGLMDLSIQSFKNNLQILRNIAPVSTICMHGSPLGKIDNRFLWKYFRYKDYGVLGEPYFDINFEKVLYLTDTGRMWNGESFSIRDRWQKNNDLSNYRDWKVKPFSGSLMLMSNKSTDFQKKSNFHSTIEIIYAVENSKFAECVLLNFHPQRWTNNKIPWIGELFKQNLKNGIKFIYTKSFFKMGQ
jgi:hypothetical protein